MTSSGVPLAGGWIDRDAPTRASRAALGDAWNEPGARVLRLRGAQIPVIDQADGGVTLSLVQVPGSDAAPDSALDDAVYLGRHNGDPIFALLEEPSQAADVAAGQPLRGERWAHPFEAGVGLSGAERELVTGASAILRWHEAEAFSPRDGLPTTISDGGWSRRDAHGAELFPRTDPAVIVLIEHDDRVLLGSNALWESGRFSLLAGFVEAGESLEQAVAREVFEEAGVRLSDIRYVASQPWPFPRSLMLGFRARLAADQDPHDLRPDASEISELRWFTRGEVRSPAPGVRLPGGLSIAAWLLGEWAAEQ